MIPSANVLFSGGQSKVYVHHHWWLATAGGGGGRCMRSIIHECNTKCFFLQEGKKALCEVR
jgi:hypothetical protein